MPYKTPRGSHYHETYGCCGATIPCGTNELQPCRICCDEEMEAIAIQSVPRASRIILGFLERRAYVYRNMNRWHQHYRHLAQFDEIQSRIEVIAQFEDGTSNDAPMENIFPDDLPRDYQREVPPVPISAARRALNDVPSYSIAEQDDQALQALKQATETGINALISHLGIPVPSYNRGLEAIQTMVILPQNPTSSSTDTPEDNTRQIRRRRPAHQQKKTGDYSALNNLITCYEQSPESKQQLSDIAMHEALHAMSSRWSEEEESWVCGFGNEPPGKRFLTEGHRMACSHSHRNTAGRSKH